MDLSLSDEQKQLQEAAERFVRDKYAFDSRRKIAASAAVCTSMMMAASRRGSTRSTMRASTATVSNGLVGLRN